MRSVVTTPTIGEARLRRSFARIGWLSTGATAIVGVTMILAPGAIGWLIAFGFVSVGTALLCLGPPYAREGKPSRARIALLNVAGAVGVAMTLAVGPVVAFGVVYLSYVTVVLTMARWPASEWRGSARHQRGRGPLGAALAVAGTVWAMLSVVGVGIVASDSLAVQIAVGAGAWLAAFGSWIWIALTYAGRLPARKRAGAGGDPSPTAQ